MTYVDEIVKDAGISDCGRYRYWLTRELRWPGPATVGRHVCFVMLNPSTADATQDDATIRRCWGYARLWGYSKLTVVNLYALRSTSAKAMFNDPFRVGPDNGKWLLWALALHRPGHVVCAWGAKAEPDRVREFSDLAKAHKHPLACLGVSTNGMPKHPLYLPNSAQRVGWGVIN
jgi:hypothetical protein